MVSDSNDVMDRVCEGRYSLLFASPEVLLSSKGKELMMGTHVYHRLCCLFVDESHCIVKWGQSSGNTEAFRKYYGMIAELRSVIKLCTPVVAMTATATQLVRSKIVQALGMNSFVLIDSNLIVQNIKHIVITPSQNDYPKIFDWLCDKIVREKEQTERVLIFCQSRKDCSELYSLFCSKLPQALHHHFNMYHTNTENDIQEGIVKDFADVNGKVRVLVCTIAFGLGVNVKGVHTVIMYGTPCEIDDYVQLCGRGGRDGLQSISVTLKMSQTGRAVSKEMKDFTKTSGCRHEILYKAFSEDSCPSVLGHNCCDNCSLHCSCAGTGCSAKPTLLEQKIASHQSECEIPIIQVSDDPYRNIMLPAL
ncbi:putative Werner syndrome ATP-dependent helicase-like 1 [Holothuria leucospilota]|uniref:DNA 3'-5' helicase n=1 Tax=Holothuria leucospilota TaxID=206669 RepID=A0A9Q1HCV1_HOLLE|nr:putative Werner syndrome ATP-dependent helicase-like 1 [Holothuria leucospilota]